MGKILTNSQGKAIIASGNAFEVTAAVDPNIQQGNIKKDVTILGVTGTYEAPTPNLQTLNVTPSTSAQQLTPTSPVDGYNEVNVSAVTSAIDQNIVAGNIKKDVAILGVTGTYEGSGGGGLPEAEENDVIFIDYDGTIRYSYSAAEFAQLSAMPANPSHEGLTAQGWNWSLADAKAYVATYKRLIIGQMYVSDDGKTKLYIDIKDISRPTMSVYFAASVDGGVTIDWGDGSATTTSSGTSATTYTHDYASVGNYVISLEVTSGALSFIGSDNNNNICGDNSFRYNWGRLRKVVIGSSVTNIGNYAFSNCYSLTSVTIPSGVTSIGNSAFRNCYSLVSVTIPSGVNIGGYTFYNCHSLASVAIPSGATSISDGMFYCCYSLASVAIPSGVTSIRDVVFYCCYSLASVAIPSGVTSIRDNAFRNCYSLVSVTIPSGVTSIGNNAFDNCMGVKYYYVEPTTPPTLSQSTFSNNASDVIIYVPAGSVNDYKTASNWTSVASRIYAMPA